MSDMQTNEYNGPIVTSIKVLHSVAAAQERSGTTMNVITTPASPFTTTAQYIAPNSPGCILDFSMVKTTASPFRATFCGTVCDVKPDDESIQGQPKKEFDLVDAFGSWLHCCAIGRNARNTSLVNGNEVAPKKELYQHTSHVLKAW